jgi:hypothetical protein
MSITPWWIPIVSVVIGVVLGYGAAELREYFRRKHERRGHFEALAVEIELCGELTAAYLASSVQTPAYRLPARAYETAFPAILAAGVLSMREIDALTRFYINVHSFNLAIDQAQATLMKREEDRPPERLGQEVRRAELKAIKLRKGEAPNQYDDAMAVLMAHLPEESIKRLLLLDMEDLKE